MEEEAEKKKKKKNERKLRDKKKKREEKNYYFFRSPCILIFVFDHFSRFVSKIDSKKRFTIPSRGNC